MNLETMMRGKKVILVEYPADFKIELLNKKKISFPFKSKIQFKSTKQVLEMKPVSKRIKKKYRNQFRILTKTGNGKFRVLPRKFDDVLKITKSISKKNN